jgi:glycosyltransferase involved in cell wall biosynthesis
VNANRPRIVAIVGRLDEPTDGVRDYCFRLSDALREQGVEMSLAEIRWENSGWRRAVLGIRAHAPVNAGDWALLQYTAIAWSRRGFPFGALAVAWSLRSRSARLAVVFHEPYGFYARGLWAWLRFQFQEWIIRRLCRLSELAIFTVPLSRLPWTRGEEIKARFIPIGSNIPALVNDRQKPKACSEGVKTIAVFGVSPVARTAWEVEEITRAVREAEKKVGKLRLLVFGRGALEARDLMQKALEGSKIELCVLGILPAQRIAEIFSQSDALLYVRDNLTPQRGCALAAVACALPLVSYGDPAKCFPLNEAGVLLAPPGNSKALVDALLQVLSDADLWFRLSERSIAAYKKYFTWDEIARKYLNAFQAAAGSRQRSSEDASTSQVNVEDTAPSPSGDGAEEMSAR